MAKRHLFGPIASRRLGRSLGVDLIPPKTCSFDCVYCEVGRTTNLTQERDSYVEPQEILAQLDEFFASGGQADWITFTGSGEPTLSADIEFLIGETKRRFGLPVAVITNGSLLFDPAVRASLAKADLVMPSLDSAREESFQAVNRPLAGISAAEVIEGLILFVKEFKGRVWLEVLFVAGINDSPEDVAALVEAVSRIQPHRVQINTVVRPPGEAEAAPVSDERLEEIAAAFAEVAPAEILAPVKLKASRNARLRPREAILETLKRRACTAEGLAGGLSLESEDVAAALRELAGAGLVREVKFRDGTFYEAVAKP